MNSVKIVSISCPNRLIISRVLDELFRSNAFFDPLDLVQVKYEMLRRVRQDGLSVTHTDARFGVSRPT